VEGGKKREIKAPTLKRGTYYLDYTSVERKNCIFPVGKKTIKSEGHPLRSVQEWSCKKKKKADSAPAISGWERKGGEKEYLPETRGKWPTQRVVPGKKRTAVSSPNRREKGRGNLHIGKKIQSFKSSSSLVQEVLGRKKGGGLISNFKKRERKKERFVSILRARERKIFYHPKSRKRKRRLSE